jgi:hypothetical protein
LSFRFWSFIFILGAAFFGDMFSEGERIRKLNETRLMERGSKGVRLTVGGGLVIKIYGGALMVPAVLDIQQIILSGFWRFPFFFFFFFAALLSGVGDHD